MWQSHTVTIVFGSIAAGVAAYRALREQAWLHAEVVRQVRARAESSAREASLRDSEARYRQLVEQSPEAIIVHREFDVVYANPSCLTLFGQTTLDALPSRDLRSFLDAHDAPQLEQRLTRLSAIGVEGRSHESVEYRVRGLDGVVRIVEATSVRIPYDGAPAIQTVLRDVTARRALEAQLHHQAFHDALTGLANRALFRDRVDHALARAGRGERLALVLIDLDHFKHVNDSLGHAAGDVLLRIVAQRLLACTRGHDTVARLGGDEFAILLENMHADDDAVLVAQRIVWAMQRPITLDGRDVVVGVSAGIATSADVLPLATTAGSNGDRFAAMTEALLRNADLALYAAKAQGRFRYVAFAPDMHATAVRRLELEGMLRNSVNALRAATDNSDARPFALVYQPIVDLPTAEITAVEALLRWRHPDGLVSPAEFVPIAEETGLIVPLGRWVIDEACRQLAVWDRETDRRIAMSVNLSGRQLADSAVVSDVERALATHGIDPTRLVLEITESVMMHDADATLRRLRALKALGVRVAIDDFGTGYSSLAYLRQFPVDILKIDKSFIDGVGHGGDETVIATAILTLGRALSLLTVAEGIEDAAQLARLRELGCVRGQGYLFDRPLPPDHVSARLAGTVSLQR